MIRMALGQDSHRFLAQADPARPLILGGVRIEAPAGQELSLEANSDGDVLLHALTNAISGLTGVNVLGARADELCRAGVIDSREYVREALKSLDEAVDHVSFSVEARRPKLAPWIPAIRESVAALLDITPAQVGLTATSGEGLTGPGRGEGIAVLCAITTGNKTHEG